MLESHTAERGCCEADQMFLGLSHGAALGEKFAAQFSACAVAWQNVTGSSNVSKLSPLYVRLEINSPWERFQLLLVCTNELTNVLSSDVVSTLNTLQRILGRLLGCMLCSCLGFPAVIEHTQMIPTSCTLPGKIYIAKGA